MTMLQTHPLLPTKTGATETLPEASSTQSSSSVSGRYLRVDERDDCSLHTHSDAHSDVEDLMEEKGVDQRRNEEEDCIKEPFPFLLFHIFRVANQLPENQQS